MILILFELEMLKEKGAPWQQAVAWGPQLGAGAHLWGNSVSAQIPLQLPTVGFDWFCQRFIRFLNHNGAKTGAYSNF